MYTIVGLGLLSNLLTNQFSRYSLLWPWAYLSSYLMPERGSQISDRSMSRDYLLFWPCCRVVWYRPFLDSHIPILNNCTILGPNPQVFSSRRNPYFHWAITSSGLEPWSRSASFLVRLLQQPSNPCFTMFFLPFFEVTRTLLKVKERTDIDDLPPHNVYTFLVYD